MQGKSMTNILYILALVLFLTPASLLAADFSEDYAACIAQADGTTQKLLECDAEETVRQDERFHRASGIRC